MKIEVGDVVELNNGEVHKVDRMIGDDPDHMNAFGDGPFVIDGLRYHKDGRRAYYGYSHNLSVKRILRNASPNTLANLHVGPGDVVGFHNPQKNKMTLYTIQGWANGRCYHMGQDFGGAFNMDPDSCWRVVRRASDDTQSSQEGEPKLWRDMTDAEKGALLLAHREGKVIENNADGTFFAAPPVWDDDVAYRIKPDDIPTLWRDMTDEEKANVPADVLDDPTNPLRIPWNECGRAAKGAVLLAEHEGKEVEFWCASDGEWVKDDDFSPSRAVFNALPYRVKPESVRETMTGYYDAAHRITFDLIDGEPDCSSIKMEPVRETVTLMIDDGSMGGPQAIGIIDLIDGEPDCSSIKMEKV